MKIKMYMKSPDALRYALNDAVEKSLSDDGIRPMHASYDEEKAKREREARQKMERWIKYGEIAWLEFDTETGTATVLETGHPGR